MADISITAANVKLVSGPRRSLFTRSERLGFEQHSRIDL